MTAGLSLSRDQVKAVTARLREGVESHTDIAADLGLSRHSVDRIARIHGMPTGRTERLPKPPPRTDVSWMEQAKCAGWLNFTELEVREQMSVCQGRAGTGTPCEVRAECLAYGLTHAASMAKDDDGVVFGGLSPRDVAALQKAATRGGVVTAKDAERLLLASVILNDAGMFDEKRLKLLSACVQTGRDPVDFARHLVKLGAALRSS